LAIPNSAPRAPSENIYLWLCKKERQLHLSRRSPLSLPRHVCPTISNFDQALLVRKGAIESIEQVSARGHESSLLRTKQKASS
jgi:hypothetical protein